MARQYSQSEILQLLHIPRNMWRFLEGNGLAQRAVNQAASRRGLPEPFNPSAAQAVVQDLLPLGIIAGAGVGEGTGAAAGAGAAGEGAASTAGGAGAISGAAKVAGVFGAAAAISDSSDFLKWISWIFHPLNLLRAVEFLVGIGTMFYGINILVHGMRRGAATHRTTIGGIFRQTFGKTPIGRAAGAASARRHGRRAGSVQGERDVAYREARRERLSQSASPPQPRTT